MFEVRTDLERYSALFAVFHISMARSSAFLIAALNTKARLVAMEAQSIVVALLDQVQKIGCCFGRLFVVDIDFDHAFVSLHHNYGIRAFSLSRKTNSQTN